MRGREDSPPSYFVNSGGIVAATLPWRRWDRQHTKQVNNKSTTLEAKTNKQCRCNRYVGSAHNLIVGPAPCHLACLLPSSTAVPLPLRPSIFFPFKIARSGRVAPPVLRRLLLVPSDQKTFGCFYNPRLKLAPTIFYALSRLQNLNWKLSVDSSVARNTFRSSTRRLCQLFGLSPNLGFSSLGVVAKIIGLGNRPSFCRTTIYYIPTSSEPV